MIKRKTHLWFTSCALFVACELSSGATYYVAKTGSNLNDGSQAQPWATIQKAANTVLPGDVVNVGPGDYGELVDCSRSAAPGQPITFRGNAAETGGFNCRKSDYVLQGFRFNGTNVSMSGAISLVYVYANAHRVQVLDNYFHDANKFAIWLDRGPNAIVTNSSSFNVISNNTFIRIDYVTINCNGLSNRVVRNTFQDNNGQADCLRLWGEGHVAADNLVTNISMVVENHTDFYQAFGPEAPPTTNDYNYVKNIVLERNIVVNSKLQICQLETFDNPRGYMTNLIVRNNLFLNLPYAANVDMDGTKWYNNVFYRCNYGNGGHVFALGGTKGSAYGTAIKNNVFFDCGSGSSATGWYPTTTLIPGVSNFDIAADYNFVCGPAYAPKATFPSNSNGWGAEGEEAHGINGGNPQFISAATYQFQLTSGSPLINAGVLLTGFSNDIVGNQRGAGTWDIGAYAYAGQFSPTAPTNLRVLGIR